MASIRSGDFWGGLLIVIAGASLVGALNFHLVQNSKGNVWDWGFFFLVEAYSMVGLLFVFIGLRYMFGKHAFIERLISKCLKHLVIVMVLMLLTALICAFFIYLN